MERGMCWWVCKLDVCRLLLKLADTPTPFRGDCVGSVACGTKQNVMLPELGLDRKCTGNAMCHVTLYISCHAENSIFPYSSLHRSDLYATGNTRRSCTFLVVHDHMAFRSWSKVICVG